MSPTHVQSTGYRIFTCDGCATRWKTATRDITSPSAEPCPKCNTDIQPHAIEGAQLPVDTFGNLLNPPPPELDHRYPATYAYDNLRRHLGARFSRANATQVVSGYATLVGTPVNTLLMALADELLSGDNLSGGDLAAKVAKFPKVGDTVELDCGYDGMLDYRPVKLLETPYPSRKLFDEQARSWAARVEILGTGETFSAHITEELLNQKLSS